jgi:hypothetical protein
VSFTVKLREPSSRLERPVGGDILGHGAEAFQPHLATHTEGARDGADADTLSHVSPPAAGAMRWTGRAFDRDGDPEQESEQRRNTDERQPDEAGRPVARR